MNRKMIAVHRNEREITLWERAEEKAREEMGQSAREGEVLARICADYLGEERPFREVEA